MSGYKILLKITGSIAAYKSATLTSKLVQQGHEVQVVATPAALEFIGKATFEGLTGKPLLTDGFEPGAMMSHISLAKWADLTIVVPATANTINKLASGIADNLVTSLFLAHDRNKPYLIAPAMNSAMMAHPATQVSLSKLRMWGMTILDTVYGRLACGDEGYGKLPDPDEIAAMINQKLRVSPSPGKILITSGGTREKIDNAREISNISTGRTGAVIADYFISRNWDVTLLHGSGAYLPSGKCIRIGFTDFDSLDENIRTLLSANEFSSVVHLAAVSDYSADSVSASNLFMKLPSAGKIDSGYEELIIRFRRNHKIVNCIKSYSGRKKPVLIAFKFTAGDDEPDSLAKMLKLKQDSAAEAVVLNDAGSRISGQQTDFSVFTENNVPPVKCPDPFLLAKTLEGIIINKING